jgi:hypothetical protein
MSHLTDSTRTRLLGCAAAFALLCAATVHASTVSLQGGFGYPAALTAEGQPAEPGCQVAIGTFMDGFDPAAHASDLPALLAAWRPYGITTTREIFGTAGSFFIEHVNNDPFFAGKPIHLLLTRTSDFASPAPDGSNVTDYGIFTSTATPADKMNEWSFPPVGPDVQPPADLRQINSSQINSSLWGALDTGSPTLAWKTNSSTEPTAWNDWVHSVFGENTDPSTIDPDAVSGSSGLKNFVAFALATNPVTPAAPAYETSTHSDGRIGIRFTRTKPSLSGYLAQPQASTDLADWTLPLQEILTATDESSPTEDVEAYLPPGTAPEKAFFRIQVSPAN